MRSIKTAMVPISMMSMGMALMRRLSEAIVTTSTRPSIPMRMKWTDALRDNDCDGALATPQTEWLQDPLLGPAPAAQLGRVIARGLEPTELDWDLPRDFHSMTQPCRVAVPWSFGAGAE